MKLIESSDFKSDHTIGLDMTKNIFIAVIREFILLARTIQRPDQYKMKILVFSTQYDF